MLRIEIFLKVFILIFFCFWVFISSSYSFNITPYNATYSAIDFTNVDIVILGGSNSLMGVNAGKLSSLARNISINSEMRTFYRYFNFVKGYIKRPKVIIYSTLDFWKAGESDKSNYLSSYLPSYPLISFIYSWFKSGDIDPAINKFGDLSANNYNCRLNTLKREAQFSRINNGSLLNLIDRVKIIKEYYKDSQVILRIPPIYIELNEYESANTYLSDLKREIEKEDIIVFNSKNSLYSIRKLACNDIWHPSYTHSLILSEELKEYLINMKYTGK